MDQRQIAIEKQINAGAIRVAKITVIKVGRTIQCPDVAVIPHGRKRLMRKGLRAFECTSPNCMKRLLFGEIAKK